MSVGISRIGLLSAMLFALGCASGHEAGETAATIERPAERAASRPAAMATTESAEADKDVQAVWNDPTFKKQFVGSYGINAEIEPRVLPDEVKILEQIRPLMADNLPQAEVRLRELMKPNGSAMLDFTLGGICFQQDHLDDALASYQTAVGKFPSFRRAYRNIGLIRVRRNEYDEAITAFTKMIELGGGDAYAYGLLGFAYSAKQDYQPAEAAYRNALLLQPDNTEWRLGLTRCVFKQEKFEDAAALLDALIARFPDKADFWLLQAHTYLGMKQPLKAAENLEAVDRLGKASVDSEFTLGDIYVSENLPDVAARAYRRAIDLDTKQTPSRALKAAEGLAGRGAIAAAREVTKHVRGVWIEVLESSDRRRLLKLEARLSTAEGASGEETARVLEDVVQIDPLDGEALMLLGQHYQRQNQPDRAIFYYERAASLDTYEVEAKVRQAQVLVGLSRYSDAIPLLRRAQEVKPRDTVARYLEQVERLSKTKK